MYLDPEVLVVELHCFQLCPQGGHLIVVQAAVVGRRRHRRLHKRVHRNTRGCSRKHVGFAENNLNQLFNLDRDTSAKTASRVSGKGTLWCNWRNNSIEDFGLRDAVVYLAYLEPLGVITTYDLRHWRGRPALNLQERR